MLHARSVRPRGAERERLAEPLPAERRRVVDRAHPGRSGRPDQELPRRRRAEGVRRDPGCLAAEGGLEVRPEVRRRQHRQLLGLDAQGGRREHRRTPPAGPRTRGKRPGGARVGAATKVSATYRYQYNSFVPIGPHCAVADVDDKNQSAIVYVQGQSINGIPPNLAGVLGFPDASKVRVIWYEGSSSYGGGQQGEAAEQAVPDLAGDRQAGAPAVDALGPARLGQLRPVAHVRRDRRRRLRRARSSRWTGRPTARPARTIDTTKELIGTATWPAVAGSGGPTPSDAAVYNQTTSAYQYQRRVLAKTQPLYNGSFKISALRAPNAPQSYFASEQIVDELAYAAGMDPIAFRRLNIDGTTHARRAVAVGARRRDDRRRAGSRRWPTPILQTGDVRTGRGFAFGTFASSQVGVVADIEVNVKTGKILVKHAYVAQNNGITVNLEGVANQMSGALIQGLSRAMLEQVDLQQGARHEPGLGHVPDPALQGRSEGHAGQRPPGRVHGRSTPGDETPGREGGQHGRVQQRLAAHRLGRAAHHGHRLRRSRTRSSTPRVPASARRR